jgi:arabinofuranan 3-O-arabinosyltransferase
VTAVDGDRFDRTVEVTGCPAGCWLVFGEGHNVAWTASVDGRSLGEPELVDGGFNGWWLDGAGSTISVDVHWTQQGRLDVAFVISIIGVLAAVAMTVLGGRRRSARAGRFEPTGTTAARSALITPGEAGVAGLTSRLALVASWAVLAGLLIQPEWALWGAVAGVASAGWRRPRLPELTALATLVVVAGLVVLRERRNAPAAGGGWPLVFDQWHGLALFAVVSLVVGALFADDAGTGEADTGDLIGSDRFEQDRHRPEAGHEGDQVG